MIRTIAILVLLTASYVAAATDPADSVARQSRYFFSVRSAALFCKDCTIDGRSVSLLSTVHGINLNKTFAVGAGVGVTSAMATWVTPLFGNVRMNMYGKKKNKLFLELNYGGAFAFGNNSDEDVWGNTSMRTTCKSYFQPSVGYSITYHDLRIGILVGVQSLKMVTLVEYPGYNSWGGFQKQGSPNSTEYGYDVSRLMVGLSIGWRD